MTVIVVTHELQSIETITDSIIYLSGGVALAEGPIDEVRSRGLHEVDNFFARTPSEEGRKVMGAAEWLEAGGKAWQS